MHQPDVIAQIFQFPEVVRTLKERHTQKQEGGLTPEEKEIIDRTSTTNLNKSAE